MKCNYCNKQIEKGTGILYVRKDGKTFNLCSNKCIKNMNSLKRNPKKLNWIK